jgi:hypothetical protein
MRNILIPTHHKRGFFDTFIEWRKRVQKEMTESVVTPTEGLAVGDRTPMSGVPEAFLPALKKQGIPFETTD